ncbi:MAG: hypothetical protein QOD14_1593 [Solirubrobacterales bacterium]|jgi:hypothetical protein|nr:hypothetical protein [Solirubrobacterales bacterium]
MRKRKYLIGALLSVIGALVVSGTASAAVTGQTYSVTTTPPKQQKKVFGPVKSFTNVVDTAYSGGFTPVASTTVLTFSRDIRFTPGNIPQCPTASVNNKPVATAKAACPGSIVGQGSAKINGGALNAVVTAFNGQPSGGSPTILLHTSVNNDALDPTLVGVLNTSSNTLTVTIPNTGTAITHFDTTINKIKSGKKTWYVMARCKKKKWTNTETTTYQGGTTTTASTTQKCKQKPAKK